MRLKLTIIIGLVLAFPALPSTSPLLAQGKGAAKKDEEAKDAGKKAEGKKAAKKAPEGKKRDFELDVQATLGAPAKTNPEYFEMTYQVVEGKKKATKKAWLKIDSSTTFLRDRAAAVAEFKEGEPLMVFGKPVSRDSAGPGGVIAQNSFRVIQASRLVIGGKSVAVNWKYADPKDKAFEWCECVVEKPGAGMTVTVEGESYKLDLDRAGSAVMVRGDGDLKKDAKKGARILLGANVLDEKAPGEEADDRPVYKAEEVIVMEPRHLKWYEALISG